MKDNWPVFLFQKFNQIQGNLANATKFNMIITQSHIYVNCKIKHAIGDEACEKRQIQSKEYECMTQKSGFAE